MATGELPLGVSAISDTFLLVQAWEDSAHDSGVNMR